MNKITYVEVSCHHEYGPKAARRFDFGTLWIFRNGPGGEKINEYDIFARSRMTRALRLLEKFSESHKMQGDVE